MKAEKKAAVEQEKSAQKERIKAAQMKSYS
jgi:hypothetical protein